MLQKLFFDNSFILYLFCTHIALSYGLLRTLASLFENGCSFFFAARIRNNGIYLFGHGNYGINIYFILFVKRNCLIDFNLAILT
jgi:hypothetical protein